MDILGPVKKDTGLKEWTFYSYYLQMENPRKRLIYIIYRSILGIFSQTISLSTIYNRYNSYYCDRYY